jgi:hypothetical protein
VVLPHITFVSRPKIHHGGLWKQGGVDRMIRMVMTDKYVRHLLPSDAALLQSLQQGGRVRHKAGINDHSHILTPDQADCARNEPTAILFVDAGDQLASLNGFNVAWKKELDRVLTRCDRPGQVRNQNVQHRDTESDDGFRQHGLSPQS